MIIRIGTAIKNALERTVGNMKMRQSGLIVPADYIAGKHFGGFSGYEPWIQQCIRLACEGARGVGKDELSEITAVATWAGEGNVELYYSKHNDAMRAINRFFEAVCGLYKIEPDPAMIGAVETQYSRVQGGRELGTLMVVALNVGDMPKTGKLMSSVSAWNPASVEEAKEVPRQKYLLG